MGGGGNDDGDNTLLVVHKLHHQNSYTRSMDAFGRIPISQMLTMKQTLLSGLSLSE